MGYREPRASPEAAQLTRHWLPRWGQQAPGGANEAKTPPSSPWHTGHAAAKPFCFKTHSLVSPAR